MVDSSPILTAARVPDTCAFFLGCFESRVTVLSQQRRALNLVDALLAEQIVRPHGRVAIVGAGASGLTAAAAFAVAAPNLRIDLFERSSDLMHLQRPSDRDLHPHIYDWPAAGSTESDAGLPILNWQAGTAKSVAVQIIDAFKLIERHSGGHLVVYTGCDVKEVHPVAGIGCRVEIKGRENGDVYDAAILSIGFGYERAGPDGQKLSYWMPASLIGPFSPGAVLLVSGNGDGGLVDFSMAALQRHGHSEMIDLVVNHPQIGELTGKLLEIERRAWADEACDIMAEYQDLLLPRKLLLDVYERLKRNTNVWLHTREPYLFRRTTAILNRLTAFLVIRADALLNPSPRIQYRTRVECSCEPGSVVTRLGDDEIRPSLRVFRFGAASDVNLEPFLALSERFRQTLPPAVTSYRPATPELTPGARARFQGAAPTGAAVTPAAESVRLAEASLTPAEQARKWLADLNIPLAPESLNLYVRSGVPEIVVNLLRAGLSPDTLLDGVSPLKLALDQFDDGVGEPDAVRTDVLRAVVAAGPRDIPLAAHDALAKPAPKRLTALLRAGAELDARDATGQSLAARAMRRDDDVHGDAATGWADLLIREGRKPPPALCAWILLWAASTGRVRLVERLLAAGVPIDASLQGTVPSESIRDSELGFWWPDGTSLHRLLARAEGPNAMMYAEADLYSPEMLRVLLRHGASTDAIDSIGRTPLHIAATEGLEDAATEFIGRPDTDLTRRDADGETVLDSALHWPRSGGIARKLLARGLPPDPAYQAHILHRAAYNRDLDFLRGVLDAGVDPNAVSGDVPGALMELAHNWDFLIPTDRRSCVPCLTLLLDRSADVSLRDRQGWTALHWLALGEEVDAIERLLAAGIDPDTAGNAGRTALMNCKSPAIAERLLAAGAQQSMRDNHGFDALDHATIYGRTDVAELLRAPDRAPSREAALIRAIMERNESVVVDLLAAGVAPDTVDPWGRPLLHVAANVLSPEMLLLLLDRGAAVDARDALGHTALDECLDLFKGGNEDYERCVTLLLDRGATTESVNALDNRGEAAIFRGFRFWHVQSIAMRLLSAGRDARGRDGRTALMAAVERGSADHVAYLLRAGLDAVAVDVRGRTALHYAARGSGDEMEYRDKAGFLLRAGATVDVPDNNGETPLIAAVAVSNHNMIDFLLDQGADPKRSNAAGENLLRIALRTRDVSLVNRFRA